ncbi:MAG: SPASM domain-containing protein [Clostridiales bacterium]|nr:SPASM domain-containing protein [Clostridiales bacterium]
MKKLFLLQGYKYLYDEVNNELVLLNLFDGVSTTYYGKDASALNDMFTCHWEHVKNKELANEMIKKGIAYVFEENIHIEEWKTSSDLNVGGLLEKIPFIEKMFLDFGDYSDIDSCVKSDMTVLRPCYQVGIKMKQKNVGYLDNFIDLFSEYYIKNLFIKGIDGDDGIQCLEELVNRFYAKNNDVVFHLIVGGKLNAMHLDIVKRKRAKMVLSIEARDFLKCENIEIAKKNKIDFSISLYGNKDDLLFAIEKANDSKLNIENVSEFIEGDSLATVLTYEQRKEIKKIKFPENFYNHNCLKGTISIDANGDVHPCPGVTESLGNISEVDMAKVFSDEGIYKWWRLSKSKIESCAGCIYRNGCEDCIVAESLDLELKRKLICENIKA